MRMEYRGVEDAMVDKFGGWGNFRWGNFAYERTPIREIFVATTVPLKIEEGKPYSIVHIIAQTDQDLP